MWVGLPSSAGFGSASCWGKREGFFRGEKLEGEKPTSSHYPFALLLTGWWRWRGQQWAPLCCGLWRLWLAPVSLSLSVVPLLFCGGVDHRATQWHWRRLMHSLDQHTDACGEEKRGKYSF